VIACLVPFVEFDGVLVGHFKGEPNQIGYLWPENFVDAMDGDEVD